MYPFLKDKSLSNFQKEIGFWFLRETNYGNLKSGHKVNQIISIFFSFNWIKLIIYKFINFKDESDLTH